MNVLFTAKLDTDSRFLQIAHAHLFKKKKTNRKQTNLLSKLNLQMFYNRDREGFTYDKFVLFTVFHRWVPDHKLFVT